MWFSFRKKVVFKEYVEKLYKLKENSAKNSSLYIISKLLLNYLYGRFGMKPNIEHHIIYYPSENFMDIDNLLLDNKVDLLSIFDDDKQLLSIKKKSLTKS